MRNLILRPLSAGLARRLTGLRDDGGRGAISVLVAVLLGAGVLFGMAALTVDVGRLYENRAELQNGADAAALAIAKSCATGTCTPSLAASYANANASSLTGGKAAVTLVCGSNTVGSVSVAVGTGYCSAAKVGCPPVPPTGTNYVDVETSTPLSAGGSSVLQPFFTGSRSNGPVRACAQAEWGGPLTSTTIGFTISKCTWDAGVGILNPLTGQPTNQPPVFAPPPPYNETDPATLALLKPFDQVVYAKGGPTGNGCSTEPNGAAAPGNFGWTSKSGCQVTITNGSYGGSTGNSGAGDCQPLLAAWRANQTVIDIPVYFSVANPGNNATFTMPPTGGFAAFVITGYSLPGFNANDWVTGKPPCTGSAWCISGFFTHDLTDAPGSLGGNALGLDIIKLTG